MTYRRLPFAVAVLLVSAVAVADSPQAEFPVVTHCFGSILETDGPVTTRFPMINIGDAPLRVLDTRANCGCTTPELDRRSVMPGDTAWISVTFNPAGRPGRFDKKIIIDTNTEPKQKKLNITGTVIGSDSTLASRYHYRVGPMRVRDRFIPFGDILNDESRGNYIEAYNAGLDTLRPRFKCDSPMLNILVQPAVVPPGEQFIYSVVVRADKRGQWGPQKAVMRVFPDASSPDTLALDVEVSYDVRESFRGMTPQQLEKAPKIAASSSRIDLGKLSLSDSKKVTGETRISNRGTDPLRVRRVWCPDPRVSISLKQDVIKRGKSAMLKVELDPADFTLDADGNPADMINIPVVLYTNDPDMSQFPLRIVAEII